MREDAALPLPQRVKAFPLRLTGIEGLDRAISTAGGLRFGALDGLMLRDRPGVAVAVGVGTAPGYARMIRGQILSARNSGYVEAAVALGHPRGWILRTHMLPNAIRHLVAVFALSVGQSIVWASSLSFLGLGVAPPAPEWGALLDAGKIYVTQAWWLTVLPGLVIVLLALATTTIGKHIQSALEKGEK